MFYFISVYMNLLENKMLYLKGLSSYILVNVFYAYSGFDSRPITQGNKTWGMVWTAQKHLFGTVTVTCDVVSWGGITQTSPKCSFVQKQRWGGVFKFVFISISHCFGIRVT